MQSTATMDPELKRRGHAPPPPKNGTEVAPIQRSDQDFIVSDQIQKELVTGQRGTTGGQTMRQDIGSPPGMRNTMGMGGPPMDMPPPQMVPSATMMMQQQSPPPPAARNFQSVSMPSPMGQSQPYGGFGQSPRAQSMISPQQSFQYQPQSPQMPSMAPRASTMMQPGMNMGMQQQMQQFSPQMSSLPMQMQQQQTMNQMYTSPQMQQQQRPPMQMPAHVQAGLDPSTNQALAQSRFTAQFMLAAAQKLNMMPNAQNNNFFLQLQNQQAQQNQMMQQQQMQQQQMMMMQQQPNMQMISPRQSQMGFGFQQQMPMQQMGMSPMQQPMQPQMSLPPQYNQQQAQPYSSAPPGFRL